MKNNFSLNTILGLGAGLLLASQGFAQTRATDDDSKPTVPPTLEVQKRIRDQIAAVLPVWDKSLLTSYETGVPWEDNLDYRTLNKLLGETPFEWEGTMQPPQDADRLVDASKSMRIRRELGAFRYQSRKRVFTPDMKGKGLPSTDAVARSVQGILGNLQFPLVEADKADVQVQEVSLSDESGRTAERFPVYAFFMMERRIEGVPVEGSTVRAAVNARGEVQRLKIAWPHFRLRPAAALLSRDRVAEEAFQKVLAQDPTEKLELAARLVYAKTEKGDFLPAVQMDVSDGETPYRLTLHVAR